MSRRPTVTVMVGLLALLLGACGQTQPDGPEPDATTPDETGPDDADESSAELPDPADPVARVVATVTPIADLVQRVGGDRVAVATLVPAGADSHTYEPRPQDVVELAEADAFFGIGLDLNPAAVALAESSLEDDAPVILLGERIDPNGLIHDHVHGDDGHTHGDDGHTHGDDGHTHGDDGHTHGDGPEPGPNPHVWTSVRLAADLVEEIAWALEDLDPDGAEHYHANAAALVDDLMALDERIEQAVATIPEGNRTLVAYHDAWTYFARDYGFELVTAVQPADYAEPSAGDVRTIIDLIRRHDVPAVFGAQEFPSGVLETIAEETDATYVGDLADDELPGAPGDPEHTYLELMRSNAATIVEALGGDPSALTRS